MDLLKKRKLDENGVEFGEPDAMSAFGTRSLTIEDSRKILEPFTREQLVDIVQTALLRHVDVLDTVRSIADRDSSQRKLFVRGLGWETTHDKLRSVFSQYGELDEAVVILDKTTGKSKGYGFVTFKHVDGAIHALKEPSKKIDNRVTVTQYAAAGVSGGGPGGVSGNNPLDVSSRKIYVANVPQDMPAERLLAHFSMYGEIEEGPLGFDKTTGKSKGFALFVYKTAESARASVVDPVKNVDGYQLSCKFALPDGKKGKPGVGVPGGAHVGHEGFGGGGGGGDAGTGMPSGLAGQYGGHGPIGAVAGYGGFSGGNPLPSALGSGGVGGGGAGGGGLDAGGLSASGMGSGNQPGGGSFGVGSGFGSALGTGYGTGSHFGALASGGYAGTGSGNAGAGLGGAGGVISGTGGLGGPGGGLGAAHGSSLYGLPPSSGAIPAGDYPRTRHYSLSSSGYQNQHQQPTGTSPAPRVPPGAMYQGVRPYY